PSSRKAGKAVGEGAPSQKTCRRPRALEPLAEGGFVHRWSLIPAALALLLALVPAAQASPAHVRVEGKTRTIFGATEPLIDASTPLTALEAASLRGEFYYHVASSQYGNYVDQIGRFPASASSGWVFKVNGAL